MLYPFHGHLLGAADPVSRGSAAATSRRIRDAGRRYQPETVLDQAAANGHLRPTTGARLFRYTIEGRRGGRVTALIGEVPVSGLLPHEGTRDTLVEPAPPIEIRPILLITRAAMPPVRAFGRPAVVTDGPWLHRVQPVTGSTGAFDGADLVIADGHHRTRAVRETYGPQARILAMVVGDGGAGLVLDTFHRVLPGAARMTEAVDEHFLVQPTRRRSPARDALLWVDGGTDTRYLLEPHSESLARMPAALRGSPAAVASRLLLPALGLDEGDVIHASTVAATLKKQSPGDAALLLPPPSMEAVMAAAEAGMPLPPKATRFAPKPVRGIVVRRAG